VITLYISPGVMDKLRPRLLALAPGTRIVSHQFTLGDWEPDEMVRVERATAYLWVVPARVEGEWSVRLEGESLALRIEQTHQMLAGTLTQRGRASPILAARIRGETIRLSFVAPDGESRTLVGRVRGGRMEGEVQRIGSTRSTPARRTWSARR
jgi:hypothetical protein